MPRRTGGVAQDHVELIVTDKDGKVQKIVTAGLAKFDTAAQNLHFCNECGHELIEIPLYACDVCGSRYVARVEPRTGKTIIFALGKESTTPMHLAKTKDEAKG